MLSKLFINLMTTFRCLVKQLMTVGPMLVIKLFNVCLQLVIQLSTKSGKLIINLIIKLLLYVPVHICPCLCSVQPDTLDHQMCNNDHQLDNQIDLGWCNNLVTILYYNKIYDSIPHTMSYYMLCTVWYVLDTTLYTIYDILYYTMLCYAIL